MKEKSEITPNPKPMFYACVLEGLRTIALDCGYALAIHGTCASDLDLIAVRWKEDFEPPSALAFKFCEELSHFTFGEDIEITKPQTRFETHVHYTIPIIGDWYVDLCVIE